MHILHAQGIVGDFRMQKDARMLPENSLNEALGPW